jgi:hypothetical protein
MPMPTLDERRSAVALLRRQVFGGSTEQVGPLLATLAEQEAALAQAEKQGARARGALFTTEVQSPNLGPETTGLEAQCRLRMAQVPTAIAHLLDANANPLITCTVRNTADKTRRVRVTSFVQGYSADAIDSFEIKSGKDHSFDQLPTFFPDALREIDELTRATLHIKVDDLDGEIEVHRTRPIWLLPQTTAPLAVKDPDKDTWSDLTRYLGAFVTPNAPAIQGLLHAAVELVPDRQFVSYQAGGAGVAPQVKALFEALKQTGIRYVNSVLAFSPDEGLSSQRVRLPRQTLESKNANCLDGTVLFASLLEAITLRPAIVLVPGHAFVAWQTDPADDQSWIYLETTVIGSMPFDEAVSVGAARAKAFQDIVTPEAPHLFRRWALQDLRTKHDVLPME